MLLGFDFARTPVLERIADLLPPEIAATLGREALNSLSPWTVGGHGPEDVGDPSHAATTVSAAHPVLGQATSSRAASRRGTLHVHEVEVTGPTPARRRAHRRVRAPVRELS